MHISYTFFKSAAGIARAGAILAVAATAGTAAIVVGPKDNIHIGGFVSQGYLQTDGTNYPFEADGGSFDLREIGLNVSTTFGSHLRVGAQVFAQRFGPYGEDEPILDWAVADYNFNQAFGVRAGRIKYPKGLYGEVLDLDALRPFVLLPLPMYNPIVRDFASSFDGAMFYGNVGLGGAGSVDYKLFYGDIGMDPDQGVADFFLTTSIFDKNAGLSRLGMDSVWGAAFDWAPGISGLKLHASYSRFSDLEGAGNLGGLPVPIPVELLLSEYNYLTLGTEYLVGDWTFAAEWQHQTGDAAVSTPVAPTSSSTVDRHAYYVMASRRLGERWELGSTFAVDYNANAAAGTPSERKRQTDFALAARFNITENLLVKAEWHAIDGVLGVFNTPRVGNPPATLQGNSQFWALKSTFTF